jgi:hypothetical protein
MRTDPPKDEAILLLPTLKADVLSAIMAATRRRVALKYFMISWVRDWLCFEER